MTIQSAKAPAISTRRRPLGLACELDRLPSSSSTSGDDLRGALVIERAVGRDHDPPRGAVEQLGLKMRLEPLDQVGHRRLGHVKRLGGPGEVARLDDPEKGAHGRKLVHDVIPVQFAMRYCSKSRIV